MRGGWWRGEAALRRSTLTFSRKDDRFALVRSNPPNGRGFFYACLKPSTSCMS